MSTHFTRRQFLAATTTTLTLREIWAAQAKQPKSLIHCVSNETYSFRELFRADKLTLHTVAQFHKDLNVRGVSLNDLYFKSWDKEYLDKILETFKANDRKITCLIMEGNLASGDPQKRAEQIETDITKLKAAAYLGAPVVRMNLGSVDKGEDNQKEGVERCVAAFKQMLPLAMDFGIRITIENHGGVSGTVDGIIAVIKGTDPRWVGSNLDFANEPVKQNPDVFARLVPYAYHSHAKVMDFKPDGEATDSDYAKLLGLLKAAKYAGAVSIEWEGNGDAVEGVKETRDLIRKHWPELPT
jgi:sugar phosphate isomerase/epimerase